jgi:hypothetical protein
MKVIYSQPYLKIERKITHCQQQHIETVEYIDLYRDKIVTAAQSFQLGDVHDISYKPFSTEKGFLYLHTNQGVFPFFIETVPAPFIDLYKEMK